MVQQHVSHFIDQEVGSCERVLSRDVSIPKRDSEGGVWFLHEPLDGDRSVNDRHYRDSRSFRSSLTLSQPLGALRRRRSISAAAFTIRAWSRTLCLVRSSVAFVMAGIVYHTWWVRDERGTEETAFNDQRSAAG